ncbi:YqhA family protein [Cyanothece sp. BG0011]|uniref:YqhA family protein n=1 Tax=Cyanothece sp. BG0011 TaxID=2082950 RepID=UPI000D1E1B79|nr:YqhA family protein [Cyanothece sp. BG0011]
MSTSEPPKTDLLLKIIKWSRFSSILAIASSLISAIFMFGLGTVDTVKVFIRVATGNEVARGQVESSIIIIVDLLEALDDFLVALALLYFAWGIYSLFLGAKDDLVNYASWLRVNSITNLKKTLLEILVVLLTVVFIKGILESETIKILTWNVLVIPISIIAIALSIRLILTEKES